MGKSATEVDFPRGQLAKTGSNSAREKHSKPKLLRDIFEAKSIKNEKTAAGKKSKKESKKNKLTSDDVQLLAGTSKDLFPAEPLTYENICEDVLSLGRVSKIQDGKISVNLPCRVVGELSLFDVSRPYSKVLEAVGRGEDIENPWYTFREMFSVGELVVVRVKKVELKNSKKKITLTTDPKDLHKNYSHANVKQGMILVAAVESVEDHGYIMDVGIENTRCFLPRQNSLKFVSSVNRGRSLGVGQIVACQVASIKETGSLSNLTLTADPKTVHKQKLEDELELNYSLLLPGMLMDVLVTEIYRGGVKVQVMDLEGYIHKDHLRETWTDPGTVELGASLPARILYLFPSGTNPSLSLQPKLFPHNCSPSTCSIPLGSNQMVSIVRMDKPGLIVRFSNGEKGVVSMRRCSDNSATKMDQIKATFSKGSSHECKVLDYNNMDGIYIASFQKSMLDEKVVRFEQVEPGVVVNCTILSWHSTGAIVTFGKVRGHIHALHFGNVPIRNPASKFPVGTSMKAKVMKVIPAKQQIQLTAKKELVKSKIPVLTSYEDCKKGLISKAVIRSTNAGGAILETIGGITIFVPEKLLGVEKGADVAGLFFQGRIVSFQIVGVNAEKRSCIATLIISDATENLDPEAKDPKEKKKKKRKAKETSSEIVAPKKQKKGKEDTREVEEIVEDADEESEEVEDVMPDIKVEQDEESEVKVGENGLELAAGSFWDANNDSDMEEEKYKPEESNEALPKHNQEKLTKKERRKLKEQKLREAEAALADGDLKLNTDDDFERLIMASPNSSICWIKFMAYYLQKEEINKAREVGMRALKTILYREEVERFNVWVALLNLENTHGTKESFDSILQEAVRGNDEYKILSTAADILNVSKKTEESEEIFKRMQRKFREQINPYIKYGKFLYSHKRLEDARDLLKKALVNLNKIHHVQLISKFCQLELEFGERDRGMTMFDQLLGTYPKRIDLWLVYANALAKVGDLEGSRSTLIKAIECRFPPKKSKPLFTRLYEVDALCSNPDPEAIRQLALEYTKSISFSSN